MGVIELIALLDGLTTLVIRVVQAIQSQPETDAALMAKLDELLTRLDDTAQAVAAWRPVDQP